MSDGPYIAEAASLIGDPARANMLLALMDGRALTATELGLAGGISASTASGHLGKLVEGRLLSVIPSGRHRYYRLASPAVAGVLEQLMVLSVDGPKRHRPHGSRDAQIALARTCYDHLAGKLGVALAQSLEKRGQVCLSSEGGMVTPSGLLFLGKLGVEFDPGKRSRRATCRPCLDWSERRWHIGGAVGAALARHFFEAQWIERCKDSRAVTITSAGEGALRDLFAVRF